MRDSVERIRASGLTKRFSNGALGLEALSLSVREGELVCLFGGPGAGKSTALHIIAGLLTPTFGMVTIDGDSLSDGWRARNRTILISGDWNHPARLTPLENLRAYVQLNGIQASVHQCRNALRDCELPDSVMGMPTQALTAEHQLLIWFAFARLKRIRALLLDEPAFGLDVVAIRHLTQRIDGLRENAAILLATSNPLLAAHADKCVVLIDGRPVLERSRGELTAQSLASTYIRLWGSRDPD